MEKWINETPELELGSIVALCHRLGRTVKISLESETDVKEAEAVQEVGGDIAT